MNLLIEFIIKKCMVKVISILILFLSLFLTDVFAGENSWRLHRFNIYFEDDIYSQTDDEYSAGERLALLFYVPKPTSGIYDLLFLHDDVIDTYTLQYVV